MLLATAPLAGRAAQPAHPSAGRVHTVIAAIETSNKTSILLHEKFGFRIVGQLPEVGHKFGGWMDLTLMQRTLPGPISAGVESFE